MHQKSAEYICTLSESHATILCLCVFDEYMILMTSRYGNDVISKGRKSFTTPSCRIKFGVWVHVVRFQYNHACDSATHKVNT